MEKNKPSKVFKIQSHNMKISKGHGASELFLVHRQDTHLSCRMFESVQSSREEYPTSLYFGYTFQRLARLKMRLIAFWISRRSGHRVIMYAVQKLPGMPLPGLPKPSWPCTREVLWFVSPCNFLCCGRDAVGLPDGKDSPSGGKRYRAPCSATDSWWHDAK